MGVTKPKRLLPTITLVAAGAMVSLVLSELGARILTPASTFAASLNLHTNLSTVLEPDLHGVETPVRFTTNRWGMRGSQPPTGDAWDATTTIVTVGGSTTQCFFLDDRRTWPAALERKLRDYGLDAWVGNAGEAGHSTHGNVRLIEEVVSKVKPDYVLVLAGVNDLSVSLRPSWKWDMQMSEALLGRARGDVMNWVLDHSRLAYRLYAKNHVDFDGTAIQAAKFTVPLPTEPVTGDEFVLGSNLDEVLPSLSQFRANIIRMIEQVRGFGGEPIFLTQPLLLEDIPQWKTVRARSFWMKKQRFHLDGASYARLLNRFNEVMIEVCTKQGATCIDLATAVPHSTDYFYDMVHLNDTGARFVGELLADELLQERLAVAVSP